MNRMAQSRSEEIELPYSEVRDIFAKTAAKLGLREPYTQILGQSVWHLSNRGYPGTANTLLFLMLNKEVLKQVWGDPEYPLSSGPLSLVCPIRTALLVQQQIEIAEEDGKLDSFSFMVGRSALPALSLPPISFNLKQKKCGFEAIQIAGPSATLSMSDAGLSEVSDTLSHEFAWVGTKDDFERPVRYTLASVADTGEGLFYPKRRLELLRLPTKRLNDDGTLEL